MQRQGKAKAEVAAIQKRVAKNDKEAADNAKALAAAEREVASAEQDLAYRAQQLTKSVNDQTRAVKDLKDEDASYTKRLRQVNTLVGKNKKEFRDLTRVTNKQRREMESLRDVNQAAIKDNASLTKQMDRVTAATKRTTKERNKYNEMVKEGTATYKQYREQSERVREAHEAERKVIGDTRNAILGLSDAYQKHQTFVDANRDSMRDYSRAAHTARLDIENLRAANAQTIRDNAGLARSFQAVGLSTEKAQREYRKYNRMARDTTVGHEALRAQLEKTRDAFDKQKRDVDNATEALRRHERQQKISAANRVTGTGNGGGGRGGRNGINIDPGRWAARNLGALTPLGVVTPTLVLPLGTLFTQVANGAVAASQAIALLPAALTTAAAGMGTLKLATAGFGDTIGALIEGDMDAFVEGIQKLSPAAQQAALTLQALGPEFAEIQKGAQEAFFQGAPQMIWLLNQAFGPMVGDLTTSIAQSMNEAMMSVGDLALSPDGMDDIMSISEDIKTTFQALEPSVRAVAEAFLDLTQVGSQLMPMISGDLTELAQDFASFISQARDSGALREFMYTGWEAIKAVGEALKNFGVMLYDVFGLKSQADVERFRDTMQEMTDVIEVVFRTLKTVFEDVAGVFRELSKIIGIFGIELDDTSTVLARIAEAWLFVHGAKALWDLVKAAKELRAALAGTAVASGAAGAAGATGGALGLLGRLGPAIAGLAGPLTAAAAGIAALGGAIYYLQHKYLDNMQLPEGAMPTEQNLSTGAVPGTVMPGTGGIPFPKLTPDQEAMFKYMGVDPRTIPVQEVYRMIGQPVPPPVKPPVNRPRGRDEYPTVPTWAVPAAPSDAKWQSTPGTFELANIPIGTFGGAEWNVPPGITDLPPDYSNLGKTGFYQPDPYKIWQAQAEVDNRGVAVEEARKRVLELRADNDATQDDINAAAQNVIQAEQSWLESMRSLKEAERGEFVELADQTKKFANDFQKSLGELGDVLDADLGLSRGLGGLAENLVKFVATLAAAPVLGRMKAEQINLGFPNGEGVGSGLIGMIAAQRGYYKSPYAMSPEDQQQWMLSQQYGGAITPTMGGNVPSGVTPFPNVGPNGAKGTNFEGMMNLAQWASGKVKYAAASDLEAGLADCSGSISDLVEMLKTGKTNSGRLFTTVNFANDAEAAKLGFLPGYQPGALNVGVTPLPGQSGHMAATLPNGVNFEGGGGTGGGAQYGGSATGALDPQFSKQYYLPIPGVTPGYAGPPSVSAPGGATVPPAAAPAATTSGGPTMGPVPGGWGPAARPPLIPLNDPRLAQTGLLTPPGFATGGIVDSVLARVTPGEFIVNPDASQKFGPLLEHINGYSTGGWVPPPNSPGPGGVDNGGSSGDPFKDLFGGVDAAAPAKSSGSEKSLQDLMGVGDKAPNPQPTGGPVQAMQDLLAPPPGAPAPAAPGAPPPPPGVPPAAVPTAPLGPITGPEAPGVPTEGSTIGSEIAPYEGYGKGLSIGGGILGAAIGAGQSAGGMAIDSMAPGAGAAASAAIGIGVQEIQRAIEFGAQAAGIGVEGLMETFLPTGGSNLANESWLLRIAGGIVGAMPALPNLAGGVAEDQLGQGRNLPGVGPATPEQVAAQGLDPNRTIHTGTGPPPGPVNNTGVNIENYVTSDNRAASQDFGRYAIPGMR